MPFQKTSRNGAPACPEIHSTTVGLEKMKKLWTHWNTHLEHTPRTQVTGPFCAEMQRGTKRPGSIVTTSERDVLDKLMQPRWRTNSGHQGASRRGLIHLSQLFLLLSISFPSLLLVYTGMNLFPERTCIWILTSHWNLKGWLLQNYSTHCAYWEEMHTPNTPLRCPLLVWDVWLPWQYQEKPRIRGDSTDLWGYGREMDTMTFFINDVQRGKSFIAEEWLSRACRRKRKKRNMEFYMQWIWPFKHEGDIFWVAKAERLSLWLEGPWSLIWKLLNDELLQFWSDWTHDFAKGLGINPIIEKHPPHGLVPADCLL